MRTMERFEKCSRKSWDFRRATIGFDSASKEIEIIANCKKRASRRSIVISPKPTSGLNIRGVGFIEEDEWHRYLLTHRAFSLPL